MSKSITASKKVTTTSKVKSNSVLDHIQVESDGFRFLHPITLKYYSLGGPSGWLGAALTGINTCPDGVGKYQHYANGSIYWHPQTGAHEVHGLIRVRWSSLGWEKSFLGYPLTDESKCPDGVGRYNHFQGGSI